MRKILRRTILTIVTGILLFLLISMPVSARETYKAPLRMTDFGISSKDKMDLANSYLALIPDNISRTLRPHVTITFTNMNIAAVLAPGYSSVAAMSLFDPDTYKTFDPKSGKEMGSVIIVENRKDAIFAVVHEVGHVFDVYCKNVSSSSFWKEVYREEKYTFVDSTSRNDGHELISEQEFFAAVFSEYMINRPNLVRTAPKAYGFMTALIQKYCPDEAADFGMAQVK